jgi:hypothetical protein
MIAKPSSTLMIMHKEGIKIHLLEQITAELSNREVNCLRMEGSPERDRPEQRQMRLSEGAARLLG